MGFNKDRSYYGNLNSLQYNMYGMEVPNDDSHYHVFGFPKGGPAQLFIFPKPGEKEHIAIVATMHPEVNLKEAWKYFTRELFCASWFRNARQLRSFSAVITCRSPIAEPYKDRILLTGDVPATLEVEITGALIWGWQAGNAISLALQEENLGMEPTAISRYINRWQEDHIKHTNHEAIMRNFGLPYALNEPGDMDYVWSLSTAPLPAPPGNTYDEIAWERGPFVEHMKLIMPIIKKERPELIPLILRAGLPCTELYAEIIKISKPIA
jgi:flavin-dependent dehydrogenase